MAPNYRLCVTSSKCVLLLMLWHNKQKAVAKIFSTTASVYLLSVDEKEKKWCVLLQKGVIYSICSLLSKKSIQYCKPHHCENNKCKDICKATDYKTPRIYVMPWNLFPQSLYQEKITSIKTQVNLSQFSPEGKVELNEFICFKFAVSRWSRY